MEPTTYERDLVASQLRQALAEAGVSQSAFAAMLGTSRTRLSTYLSGKTMPSAALHQRALRAAAALRKAHTHGWMTPDQTADAVNAALHNGDEAWAFKLVIQARDQLAAMLDLSDPAADMWALPGRRIADPRFEALLAALVGHEFELHDRDPRPDPAASTHLDIAWVLPNVRRGEVWTRAHTPEWLAARRIYISDLDLSTA